METQEPNKRLTESMVTEAIDFAKSGKDVPYEKMKGPGVTDAEILEAVNQERSKPDKMSESSANLSTSRILLAVQFVAEKRSRLAYFIKPFRRYIPKFLLQEVPGSRFMYKQIKQLGFLDKKVTK